MPLEHLQVPTPDGHELHVVAQGTGPLVLLLHGFPERWTAWHAQLPALAAAGYRAAAIDVRGYGRSSVPAEVEAYRMTTLVADVVAVVHALGATTAAVVGHDWGSPIASACALMRPDVVTAVGLLGVPFTPRSAVRPSVAFAAAGTADEDFYVQHLQTPGRAEQEIEADVRGWVRGFYAALDGASPPAPGWFLVPHGQALRDCLPTDAPLPAWLDATAFDEHVAALERTGLAGALHRYRNVDRDWEDLAAFDGRTIDQPAIFVAGAQDDSLTWLADAVAHQADRLPGLTGVHLLEGCGHWVQQERPDEVNALLVAWLDGARAQCSVGR